jgi:hypothetical protein
MRCLEMARPPVKKRLRNARRKRQRAARILQLLAHGDGYSLEELLHNPREIGHVRLWTLMTRSPHLGEAGVRKCLTRAKVYPMTRLDELTTEEADRVIACLPPRARS